MPYLRACVLDTLRLFPTTPAILRDTTEDTVWRDGVLPAGTGVLVHAPFLHRDDRVVADADRFAPGIWLDETGALRPVDDVAEKRVFLPFSMGPGICPGRHLVLYTVSTVLAVLLQELVLHPIPEPLDTERLPSALSPFSWRFTAAARA